MFLLFVCGAGDGSGPGSGIRLPCFHFQTGRPVELRARAPQSHTHTQPTVIGRLISTRQLAHFQVLEAEADCLRDGVPLGHAQANSCQVIINWGRETHPGSSEALAVEGG